MNAIFYYFNYIILNILITRVLNDMKLLLQVFESISIYLPISNECSYFFIEIIIA